MVTKSSQELCAELRKYIDDTKADREHECREYLQYAHDFLFRDPWCLFPLLDSKEIKEYRLHVGDSDYIIVAKVKNELGKEVHKAYVWELKAPQCPIFIAETKNRLSPSPELYKAINQLLHYYSEIRENGTFLKAFPMSPADVKIGGIIIGCNRNRIPPEFTGVNRDLLHSQVTCAWNILFESKIRLLDWEKVLEWMSPKKVYKEEKF
jgi:hypothetical protein